MIRSEVILNTKQLDNLQSFVRAFPDYANDIAETVFERYKPKLLDELRYAPPKPKYPIQWTSRRQQRFVMAKLREEGNLPYRRTGKLTRSWYAWVRRDGNRIELNVANNTPYASFVVGDLVQGRRKDPQQRFHRNSGWLKASPTVDFWTAAYRDAFVKEFNQVLGNVAK